MQLFDDSSPYSRPFDGLDTRFRQMSFYKKHFNLIVSIMHVRVKIIGSVNMLHK